MNYFMVIDVGTGSGRTIIFDELGNQINMTQKEWQHLNVTGCPGAIDFDVEGNWRIIKDLMKENIRLSGINPNQIQAISSCSMREGIVLYDKKGKEIWACSNVDARAKSEVEYLIKRGLEDIIYQKTGQTFSLSDAPRLLWVKQNLPDIYKDIHSLGMISDWVNYKLSNRLAVEPSNASTSGLFHTFERKWSEEIFEVLELPANIYPKTLESGEVLGTIDNNISEEIGLNKNTLIVAGGGDVQLGTLGVGSIKEGDCVILGGTFWQQTVNIDTPIPHPEARIRINAHVMNGQWQYEGISFFVGLVMRWFRDAFCDYEKKIASELDVSPYSLLDLSAKKIPPGSYGIIPIFSDVMNYKHWKHAAPSFINFDINEPQKYHKGTFYRALMENAAFNAYGNLLEIAKVIEYYPKEAIFAGGASYSHEWCKIVSNILGIRLNIPKVKEASALGAMICAAVGAGIFKDLHAGAELVRKIETIYEPDKEVHLLYKDFFTKWREIYKTQLSLADRGLVTHMWKAPGE